VRSGCVGLVALELAPSAKLLNSAKTMAVLRANARIATAILSLCSAATVLLAPSLGWSDVEPCADTAPDCPVNRRLEQLFGASQPFQLFLHDLQAATAADDRPALAAMVSYPLAVHLSAGRRMTVHTPQEFLAEYGQLMPDTTRAAVTAQKYADLFANSRGVMIGNGQVWFAQVCADERCKSSQVKTIPLNP